MFWKSNRNQFAAGGSHDNDFAEDGVGADDGAYVGAEHVHVLAEAEVVVAGVAVLLLVVKHVWVDNPLASEHKDHKDYHYMIIIVTRKG